MRCLVCRKRIERGKIREHIRSAHLRPPDLTQEKILQHAIKVAQPIEVKTGSVTCTNLRENIIYFSLDNAELHIAFAGEHADIPWDEIVEWRILHEKGHLQCKDLYERPNVAPHVLMNVEDYYINTYLLPKKYWQACIMNARCATTIRNISPLPYDLRDGYFYSTLATFLAYGAVTLADFEFLHANEVRFVEIISKFFGEISSVKKIPMAAHEIDKGFERLYPPKGISWDSWYISNNSI